MPSAKKRHILRGLPAQLPLQQGWNVTDLCADDEAMRRSIGARSRRHLGEYDPVEERFEDGERALGHESRT